jgi:hypothetical protein
MVQEGLVFDLQIIDYLELFNSTIESSRFLGISQSSCSRRYRSFSESCGIGFDRIAERYQATSNLDVLACLRQATQKLRVRQGLPRLCVGWHLGEVDLPGLSDFTVVMPMRPMSTWRLLSLLEERLLDVALMGLMECEAMLGHPLSRLRARRMPISQAVLCVPVALFGLRLIAHRTHPLQDRKDLTPEDLAQFASPALPLGMAPALMGALQEKGLASQPCGLHDYNEERWEGFAAHGAGLSYAAPHCLRSLRERYEVEPLAYDLGITECIAVVGHRDVLNDTAFPAICYKIVTILRQQVGLTLSAVQWLS